MDGGYPFPSEMEEEETVCTEDIPVSPKNREEMSSTPEIFSSDDTVWVANEETADYPASLQHDYSNVMQSTVENHPKAIPDETLDSPPQTVITSNESPNALMDSEGLQPELLNGIAADSVSSKNSDVSLFQVMKIVSDKQELSFVEKLYLPEEQILGLCNRIAPNTADNQYPDIRIDFNYLNQRSLPTIGFYGDKRTMGRILKEMGVVDDSFHKQMEEDIFEPGLYVGLLEQVIIVFYWQEGNHLKDASRKNVSCNFIRYVVDLCDNIYVCVEEQNLQEALVASITTTSRRLRRTQRLKISHVQNSENDVKVSSGFKENIGRYISTAPPEGLAIPNHTLLFAEGYHRCAFLTANYKRSIRYFSTRYKKVNASALGSELGQMSKDYDLDFTRLSNDDFVSLLEHSALPDLQGYKDLMKSIQDRRIESQKCNIQSKLNELQEKVSQNFLQVLPEYCSFIQYMSDSTSKGQEHIGGEEIPIQTNSYEQLENQLGTIWGSNSGKRKLLFAGVEIKFHPSSGMESSFIIEGSEKYAHPILFEEEITLRRAGEGDNKIQKARIFPTRKDGSIKKRPVLSGEQLILQFRSNRKLLPGTVEVINVSDYAINEWIKRLVPKMLLNVAQNIVFLCFLMSNGILEHLEETATSLRDKCNCIWNG